MKNIFTLLYIVNVTMASAQNLSDGLQACYPFDGNANNYASTGSPLNGTLSNVSTTTGHTNLPNTAYQLDGNVGSYIELPDHPGIKSDPVFFSCWFRIDSLPGIQYLLYNTNGCISNFEAVSVHTYFDSGSGQQVFCLTKCSDCVTKPQILSQVAPAIGNWYYLCFFISNSVMKLWVNGALQSSLNHNVPFGYQSGFNMYLGVTNQSHYNHPFKGAIDNVRLYNRELTQQEITLLYTQDPQCGPIPVSVFSGSQNLICSGDTIIFVDQSTNNPTSWNWQFPGASPATSSLSTPSVSFPGPGVYTVSLLASNSSGYGNASAQTITVNYCTSLTDNSVVGSRVRVFPNPASDHVYIENLSANTVFVHDLLGKPVKYDKKPVTESVCEIRLREAIPGVYFVKIAGPHGIRLCNIKLILVE